MKKTILYIYIALCILMTIFSSCEKTENESNDSSDSVLTESSESNHTLISSNSEDTFSQDNTSGEVSSQDNILEVESTDISTEYSSDISGSSENYDADTIVLEVYEKYKIFLQIYRRELECNESVEIIDGDKYYKVNDERFKTFSDLRYFINELFIPKLAEEYIDFLSTSVTDDYEHIPATYIEKEGILYVADPEQSWFLGNWDINNLKIEQAKDNIINSTVPVYIGGRNAFDHDLILLKINEVWVISYFAIQPFDLI